MFFRFHIALLIMVVWANNALAQQPMILIKDAETGDPMVGAHVSIKPLNANGKSYYEITDVKGQAKNEITQISVLTVSYLGYINYVDTIQPGATVQVPLRPDPLGLTEVVITSHSVPTRIEESVFKIKVIDRQRIESQGAMNLRDLLTNDLNFRVSQDNQLGAGVRMQGVGGENVKIMIDGVPVVGRLDGNIDLSQINLNNIEKIEIIEGPSSVNYGSNALGGVINLITKKSQTHKLEGSINTFYETVGNYNVDARLGYQYKKNYFQLSGGRYFFDGFTNNDSIPRFQDWKPKEQYFGELMYTRSLKNLKLRYQGNFFREMIQSKGRPEAPFNVMATDQYFRTIRTTHSLFLSGYIKENHHLDITASYSYYNRNRTSYRKDLTTLDQVAFDQNTDEFQLWMSRGIYNFAKKDAKLNVQAGYDVNIETAQGQRIANSFQWMGDFAGFASLEYRPHKSIVLKPGFRYGYNSKFTMIPVPSFHVKYTPVKGLDIRASYARGFRAPSLKELYFIFVDVNHNIYGNANLGAETSHNANMQLSYGNKIGRKLEYTISLSGFYNDISNQIRSVATSITPDSNIFRNENINRFQTAGGQAQLSIRYQNLNIGIGATYTGVLNGIYDSVVGGANHFVFYPELQTNASYDFKKWRGRVNVFFKYTGAQPVLYTEYNAELKGDVIKEGRIDGFANLDISYTQTLFKNRFQIAVFAKNLLNVTNVNQTLGIQSGGAHSGGSSSLPTLWGRSFGISLKYNFIVN